jgi:hypothetical protein
MDMLLLVLLALFVLVSHTDVQHCLKLLGCEAPSRVIRVDVPCVLVDHHVVRVSNVNAIKIFAHVLLFHSFVHNEL